MAQTGDSPRYALVDLVELSGLPERTIRHYISLGLIPPAEGRGRARYYTARHLQDLAIISQLRDQRLSLDEIRERLTRATEPEAPAAQRWERVALHPDLELFVRDDAPESVHALVREIHQLALRWFGSEE